MTRKLAIVNCADTGPLESLVEMFDAIDYDVITPGEAHRKQLKSIGLDLVLSAEGLADSMGYEHPEYRGKDVPQTGRLWEKSVAEADLFVDLKAHRSYSKIIAAHPRFENRVLWYRINGGEPEHVVNERGDFGDEINPPCPVLTPNQWYQYDSRWAKCHWMKPPGMMLFAGQCPSCSSDRWERAQWKAYCMWPPFVKFDEYAEPRVLVGQSNRTTYDPPICLIHNAPGWGYRDLINPVRGLGVRVYGAGSPDGLIKHFLVKIRLRTALAMVHLKSNDAPGYALYEAMAAACPIILPRRLIWRCRMEGLFRPGVNCLVFDRETHDPLSEEEVRICTREIADHLKQLSDKNENRRIGEAGRDALKRVTWSRDRPEDVESLRAFMTRNFP